MKCLRQDLQSELERIGSCNDVILGWCNVARVSNIVSHRRLRWLGHLARMPDDRLPKRVLFGHMDGNAAGFRGRAQKQWADYVREDLQFAGLSLTLVEEIPGQGSLEGCHRMLAATHLIYGLESV